MLNKSFFVQIIQPHEEDLKIVKELMSKWYASYEKLCQIEMVKKVRGKIIENKSTAFLVSRQARQPSG